MKCVFAHLMVLGLAVVATAANAAARYGTEQRPRPCPANLSEPAKGAPSVKQATAFFYCDAEAEMRLSEDRSFLLLADDLKIEIAPSPRKATATDILAYQTGPKGHIAIDERYQVYDIRASVVTTTCNSLYQNESGGSCSAVFTPRSPGICFRDSFGEWHCRLHRDSWRSSRPIEEAR